MTEVKQVPQHLAVPQRKGGGPTPGGAGAAQRALPTGAQAGGAQGGGGADAMQRELQKQQMLNQQLKQACGA